VLEVVKLPNPNCDEDRGELLGVVCRDEACLLTAAEKRCRDLPAKSLKGYPGGTLAMRSRERRIVSN
jgi:hypothetical protein